MQPDWFAVAVIVAVTAAVYGLLTRGLTSLRIRQAMRGVPTPALVSWPFLGHALNLAGPRPWYKMRRWCEDFGQSKLVYFKVLDKHVLYIAHPPLLKRVLQTKQRDYRKDLDSFKHFRCLLGQGLVTSEDEKWRHGRLLLSQAMRIDILGTIPAVGIRAAARLIRKIRENGEAKPTDVDEEFRHLTLQVIGEAVLSLPADEVTRVLPQLYLPVVHEANKRVWAPWRPFMPWLAGCRARDSAIDRLNRYISDYVRKRWRLIQAERAAASGSGPAVEPRAPDILDRYMTQLESCGEAEVLQVRDDLKTMLLAGHETSAATLTWATYELLSHPEIAEKVREEHDRVFGDIDLSAASATVSAEAVKQLKWAPAVLREAMRLHGVVPLVMRIASKDDVIPAAETGIGRDVRVPKGCTIMVGIDGVHNREDLWPDAARFNPERFFDMDAVDPYAYIPFINGPRNCLGQHLSFLEMQIVLSLVWGRLNLKPAMSLEAAGEPHSYVIPTVPAHGLLVSGTPRRD